MLKGWCNVLGAFSRHFALKVAKSAKNSAYEKTAKNLLIKPDTKVMCQGFTGKQATFHISRCMTYGTNVVGGISPKKGGTLHLEKPVYGSVREMMAFEPCDASVIFVPAYACANAIMEAVREEVGLIVAISEGVPLQDMVRVRHALLTQSKSRLLGPNSPGLIAPGKCKIGIMPANVHLEGCVGIASRSGTLMYEAVAQTTKEKLGQSLCIGIGGDPYNGTSFIDCLDVLLDDENTKGIILIGEIGGMDEERAAAYIRSRTITKPIIAYVAGITAPPGRTMGHAGAIIQFGKGLAKDKIAEFQSAGVEIARSPADMGKLMATTLFDFEKLKEKASC